MGQTFLSPTLRREPGSVVAWRTERLLAAGFDRELAGSLAAEGAVDLPALLGLVDRGCPPSWRRASSPHSTRGGCRLESLRACYGRARPGVPAALDGASERTRSRWAAR